MRFDFSKLRGRIVEKYGAICNFVEDFGGSYQNFSLKLNNRVAFSFEDVIVIIKLLEIPKEEIGEYFFTLEV